MKEFLRFEIVRDVIYIFEADAAFFETEFDCVVREAARVVYPNMAYATEFLFFDSRYESPVANQRRRRISLLPGYSEYIHQAFLAHLLQMQQKYCE
jgi:hypothetical protein